MTRRDLTKRHLNVFLCHGSEDKGAVRDIYLRLRKDGVMPWLDEVDILPGQDWDSEIRRAVRQSHVILVCLSSSSVRKEGYLQKEIRFALDTADEKPDGTIFIIPVKFDDCELPERLRRWQWVDWRSKGAYTRILRSIQARAHECGLGNLPGKATALAKKAISATAARRRAVDKSRNIDRAHPPTLTKKDDILHNCVVIVGASVRHPPSSTEQLFRQNAQLSDLMYLPHLDCGPNPLTLTDSMVIALSEPERKRLLGEKHLLVIGGPTVNVATRYLNNKSIFPFCFDEQKRSFDDIFDTLKGLKSLRNSHAVEHFYEMLKRPASEVELDSYPFIGRDMGEIRDDVEKFRGKYGLDNDVVYDDIFDWLTHVHGFFDPLSVRVVQPSYQKPNLGVISLGKNPWADESNYVCITVAGFNPFGTVGALRALVYSAFNDHPCGGILNVALPKDSREFMRFTDAEFVWITDPYSVIALKAGLEKIRKDNRKNRPTYKAFHGNEHYFNEYSEFVQSFT